MHLDSGIVQIDNYQTHFLVSTKYRTFLCDGENGLYKQIGEKIRNGNNGACFCKESWCDSIVPYIVSRGIFKTVEDNGEFKSISQDHHTKIFCARPRGRLWEVNFGTSVLKTYNFRNLPQKNKEILLIDESQDAKLKTKKIDITTAAPLNFNNIQTVCNRFIVTCDSKSIHIVDPLTSSLVFSKNGFKHLVNMQVLRNLI